MNRNLFKSVLGIPTALLLMAMGSPQPVATADAAHATTDATAKDRFREAYGNLPLSFEANAGQTDSQVKFLSRGPGYTLFLTGTAETVLVLDTSARKDASEHQAATRPVVAKLGPESLPPAVLRMKLVGAKPNPEVEGLGKSSGRANYFIGNDSKKWRTNVPLFAKVDYRDVYPGVDLVYYGNQKQLEYDFILAPHADPDSITMAFKGAKLSRDAQGNLVLATKDREVRYQKPVVYQEVDGGRREIPSSYKLKGAHHVGFQVAAYDHNRPLIIDPVLAYSTYFPGQTTAIAVDAGGNAYITGQAGTTNFPTTPGAFQTTGPPDPCLSNPVCLPADAFVTKLNPAGSALVYSTLLGGTQESAASGIAVDAAGNAYVTGYSVTSDFPTTPGAFQTVNRSAGFEPTAFVAKLNPTGSALGYSTYLGGSDIDKGLDIAIDGNGNAYVTGWTTSSDFPTTLGAIQPIRPGSANAFMTKLNANGTAPLYSTYLGGRGGKAGFGGDEGLGIAVDPQGNAYVAGTTCSDNFPVTLFAFQMFFQGYCDAFVTKLNPALLGPASLVYSTYLGGVNDDAAHGIVVDRDGNAYIAGHTCSANFPTTPLAFQMVSAGACDAFVAKLNPAGSGLGYSTFLGGHSDEYAMGIAIGTTGNIYVSGRTGSANFPTTSDAFQPIWPGTFNAFVTVLNPARLGPQSLVYSTYLGGTGYSGESALRIAVDSVGDAYVTGWTDSADFPTTPDAFQTAQGWNFVTKFSGF